jgi:hypothetical protein
MASSIGRVGSSNDPLSDMEDKVQELLSDRDIPECKVMSCHLWTTKCVSLDNDNGIAVGEGICHSVKSDLVVGSTGPLRNTQVAVQISKSLKPDEFPDDWRYSVRAWPIIHVFYNGASFLTMRSGTSLIVED